MEQNVARLEQQIKEIERQKELHDKIKKKMNKYFNFEITSYIIDDIVISENYYHFCLMVNLAVVNNRLSAYNGEILKAGIKKIFRIENNYDLLKPSILF